MTYPIVGSPPGYFILLPCGDADGTAEILPVIAWRIIPNAPPQPVTVNGPVEDVNHGLECPDGKVLDKELPACASRDEWLELRNLADERAGRDPAHFHVREPGNNHDA